MEPTTPLVKEEGGKGKEKEEGLYALSAETRQWQQQQQKRPSMAVVQRMLIVYGTLGILAGILGLGWVKGFTRMSMLINGWKRTERKEEDWGLPKLSDFESTLPAGLQDGEKAAC